MVKRLFLPQISGGVGDDISIVVEQEMARLATGHPEQGRPRMVWHPILAQVARARCWDMALRHYEGHVDPDGFGPNWYVRQAGYSLPDYYDTDRDGNNVESIQHGGGGIMPDDWYFWLTSEGHRTHLLGSNLFYAQQQYYGFGYVKAEGSVKVHYRCFLSAP